MTRHYPKSQKNNSDHGNTFPHLPHEIVVSILHQVYDTPLDGFQSWALVCKDFRKLVHQFWQTSVRLLLVTTTRSDLKQRLEQNPDNNKILFKGLQRVSREIYLSRVDPLSPPHMNAHCPVCLVYHERHKLTMRRNGSADCSTCSLHVEMETKHLNCSRCSKTLPLMTRCRDCAPGRFLCRECVGQCAWCHRICCFDHTDDQRSQICHKSNKPCWLIDGENKHRL